MPERSVPERMERCATCRFDFRKNESGDVGSIIRPTPNGVMRLILTAHMEQDA